LGLLDELVSKLDSYYTTYNEVYEKFNQGGQTDQAFVLLSPDDGSRNKFSKVAAF
jgi:hypothetical protein